MKVLLEVSRSARSLSNHHWSCISSALALVAAYLTLSLCVVDALHNHQLRRKHNRSENNFIKSQLNFVLAGAHRCRGRCTISSIHREWPLPCCLLPAISQAPNASASRHQSLLHLPIKSGSPSLLLFRFSFLLHTYLVERKPAQELASSAWRACIAHRGVTLCSIVLRGHSRRNF